MTVAAVVLAGWLAGRARADVVLTNTVYVDYRNAVGLPQITASSSTTFGWTTTFTGSPPSGPPSGPPGTIRLVVEVLDSTGRLVRTVTDALEPSAQAIASVGDGHGRGALGGGAGVPIVLSGGSSLAWDGFDAAGGRAPNGLYTVRVTNRHPDGTYTTAAVTVAVEWLYGGLLGRPVLAPNPARGVVWLAYQPGSPSQTTDLRVYSVAGELVYHAQVPGTVSAFSWDLVNRRGSPVAPGLYVVTLDAADAASGRRDRAILKLAVKGP